MIFPVLGIVLVGMILLAVRYRYLNKKNDTDMADFFTREQQANSVPAKDLSNLPYITINLGKFPLEFINDSEVQELENKLKELSNKKILNLTQKTNTDLKEEYGLPNLQAMQEIGENFNELTILLVDYAEQFFTRNMYNEAITILEFGVVIKSDVSKNYTLLADCYKELGQYRRIQTLKEQVEANPGMDVMKGTVLRYLNQYLESEENITIDDINNTSM